MIDQKENKWLVLWQGEQLRRWLYVKLVKWIPVVYGNIPDTELFCNVYIKMVDGIPLILDRMRKNFEQAFLDQLWHEATEQESLEIILKAWRQALLYWNTVWDTAVEISSEWKTPFIIRFRTLDEEKIKDIEVNK